jgi:hypothetical protein
MALEGLLGAGYLLGVHRLAVRGRRWAPRRTASFLGGVLVLVIALQSGLASLDDIFWVHVIQHLALMMVAPPLLVAGAPLVLGMAAGGPVLRRTLHSIVRDPSMRLTEGRFGIVALALLGLVTALRGPALGLPGTQGDDGAVALILGGALATAVGLAIAAAALGHRRAPGRVASAVPLRE